MEPTESRDDKAVEEELPLDLPPMEEMEVREVEDILKYHFKNQKLLEEALTHASYYSGYPSTRRFGPCYDRLEFIGDSVLNFIVTTELFFTYTELPPGQLTLLRAANVDTEKLSRITVKYNLFHYLRHNIDQLDTLTKELTQEIQNYPIHSNGLLYTPKPLADIIESIIGAIYIDSNCSFEIVSKIFKNLAEPLVSLKDLEKHPVSELLELCQKNRMNVNPDLSTWKEDGNVKYYIDGSLFGSATYTRKKDIAQNRAAKAALDNLKKMLMKEPGLN